MKSNQTVGWRPGKQAEKQSQVTGKGGNGMRIINICNLKGGVAKTVTATNLAYGLSEKGKKVLLLDNDKQANATKFFNRHSYEKPGTPEVLTGEVEARAAIQHTDYEGIDIIPANMNLLAANRAILLDESTPQHEHLKRALAPIQDDYDFCIIDNSPDANMSVINALVAGDDFIIPIKIDRFTMDGVEIMLDYARQVQENYNPRLKFCGCLITSYRGNEVNKSGAAYLEQSDYNLFQTRIHWTPKIDESTFVGKPIREYSPHSWAARGYKQLTEEYLEMIGEKKPCPNRTRNHK